MRGIKVTNSNLDFVERLLQLAVGAKCSQVNGAWLVERNMRRPSRGTMLVTTLEPQKNRRQALKEAVKEFGVELRAVFQLLPRVGVFEASQSYTQHSIKVTFDQEHVDYLNNTRPFNGHCARGKNPFQQYTLAEAKLVGAGYILCYKRDLLDSETYDPVASVVEKIYNKKAA